MVLIHRIVYEMQHISCTLVNNHVTILRFRSQFHDAGIDQLTSFELILSQTLLLIIVKLFFKEF